MSLQNLTRFPRLELIGAPTPLEYLPRLSDHLGREIFIKRDDVTPLAMGGNKLRYLTEGSSVLGLLVMGALVAKWTTVNMPLVLSSYTASDGKQVVTTVQSILDSLMPGMVPLLMTFACMYLLKKGVNPLVIIIGLFVLGIVGYAIGLFA